MRRQSQTLHRHRFNEAGSVRSRKHVHRSRTSCGSGGFNEAGSVRSRKLESAGYPVGMSSLASMRPAL